MENAWYGFPRWPDDVEVVYVGCLSLEGRLDFSLNLGNRRYYDESSFCRFIVDVTEGPTAVATGFPQHLTVEIDVFRMGKDREDLKQAGIEVGFESASRWREGIALDALVTLLWNLEAGVKELWCVLDPAYPPPQSIPIRQLSFLPHSGARKACSIYLGRMDSARHLRPLFAEFQTGCPFEIHWIALTHNAKASFESISMKDGADSYMYWYPLHEGTMQHVFQGTGIADLGWAYSVLQSEYAWDTGDPILCYRTADRAVFDTCVQRAAARMGTVAVTNPLGLSAFRELLVSGGDPRFFPREREPLHLIFQTLPVRARRRFAALEQVDRNSIARAWKDTFHQFVEDGNTAGLEELCHRIIRGDPDGLIHLHFIECMASQFDAVKHLDLSKFSATSQVQAARLRRLRKLAQQGTL